MSELLIDPNIRSWVFLPLVVITLLVGVFRHYVSLCFATKPEDTLTEVESGQVLHRVRLLRRNGSFLPRSAFLARKHYLRQAIGELSRLEKQRVQQRSRTTSRFIDPAVFIEMIKCTLVNVLPMVLVGGWVNWMFSGFVTTKVPFPLTLRFKPMLQRGIELRNLDASWVSSVSWYFLNVFGLRAIYRIILGENNFADGITLPQDQLDPTSSPSRLTIRSVYKSEYDTLGAFRHKWNMDELDMSRLRRVEE